MPVTYWTFLVGCIAIAGVPGFSGFFSKDEIMWKVFANYGGSLIFWIDRCPDRGSHRVLHVQDALHDLPRRMQGTC